ARGIGGSVAGSGQGEGPVGPQRGEAVGHERGRRPGGGVTGVGPSVPPAGRHPEGFGDRALEAEGVEQARPTLAEGPLERALAPAKGLWRRLRAGERGAGSGSGRPARPQVQLPSTGQRSQAGDRGAQTVAPRSSIAWFHAQPSPAGTSWSARSWASFARSGRPA